MSRCDLEADLDAQDVVVLNLSRAVQLCVDIAMHQLAGQESATPQTMGDAFSALERLGTIVFAIATEHLDDFRAFAKAMLG